MCGVFICTPIYPCTSSCAAAAAAFSHPFLFPAWSLQRHHRGAVSARRRSPPGYPPLMPAPFTPSGKSVISPSRWVCVPSDQPINYILAWLCSAFLTLSHRLPFALIAAPQSGTGIAHQFEMLKHFCPLGLSDGLWELFVAPIGFNPSLESSNQSQCFCCPRLRLFGLLHKIFVTENASPNSF